MHNNGININEIDSIARNPNEHSFVLVSQNNFVIFLLVLSTTLATLLSDMTN